MLRPPRGERVSRKLQTLRLGSPDDSPIDSHRPNSSLASPAPGDLHQFIDRGAAVDQRLLGPAHLRDGEDRLRRDRGHSLTTEPGGPRGFTTRTR